MDMQQLKEVIESHQTWLLGGGGTRADLSGANLSGADISNANLLNANLSGADLSGADLSNANLLNANLSGADLSGADLSRANLSLANLSLADLSRANLSRADLSGADLSRANLSRADLSGADLSRADLSRANLPHFMLPPEEGDFIAWKKVINGVVLKLLVPQAAKRTSSLVGRKCRAEHVVPLEAFTVVDGELAPIAGKKFRGKYNGNFWYTLGRKRCADKYDPDIRVECTHGIHFFMTAREAMEW